MSVHFDNSSHCIYTLGTGTDVFDYLSTVVFSMAAARGLHFLGRGVPEVAKTSLLKNKAWIGGRWVDAITQNTYPVYNPTNREVIADVSENHSSRSRMRQIIPGAC